MVGILLMFAGVDVYIQRRSVFWRPAGGIGGDVSLQKHRNSSM